MRYTNLISILLKIWLVILDSTDKFSATNLKSQKKIDISNRKKESLKVLSKFIKIYFLHKT